MRNGCQAGLAQRGLCHLPRVPSTLSPSAVSVRLPLGSVLGPGSAQAWALGEGQALGRGCTVPPSAEPPSQLGPMPLGTEVGRVRVQAGTGHWELVPDEAELPRERGAEK